MGENTRYPSRFACIRWKLERHAVASANPETIRLLRDSGGLYGSDGKLVFFEGVAIGGADADTFRVIDWRKELSRDANRIDWKSSLLSDDPENFQVLDRGYSKDRQNVYYANWIVEDADPETFVVTGTATSHAHDKSHRYNMGRKEDMGRKDVEP